MKSEFSLLSEIKAYTKYDGYLSIHTFKNNNTGKYELLIFANDIIFPSFKLDFDNIENLVEMRSEFEFNPSETIKSLKLK